MYASGLSAGASAQRNRVAMAEIASRERLAAADRALRSRELDQRERLALEGMKSETERFLLEIETKREDMAANREFAREMAQKEYDYKRQLQAEDPRSVMAQFSVDQANAWKKVQKHLNLGGAFNDPEIQGDLAIALAGSNAMTDYFKARQYGGTGPSGDNKVGTYGWAMARAGGDEVQARRIQHDALTTYDQIGADEQLIKMFKDQPELLAGSEYGTYTQTQQRYLMNTAKWNAWLNETGETPYESLSGTNIMSPTQIQEYERRIKEQEEARKEEETPSFLERMLGDPTFGFSGAGLQPGGGGFGVAFPGTARGMFSRPASTPVVRNRNTPTSGVVTNSVIVNLGTKARTTGTTVVEAKPDGSY